MPQGLIPCAQDCGRWRRVQRKRCKHHTLLSPSFDRPWPISALPDASHDVVTWCVLGGHARYTRDATTFHFADTCCETLTWPFVKVTPWPHEAVVCGSAMPWDHVVAPLALCCQHGEHTLVQRCHAIAMHFSSIAGLCIMTRETSE